MEKIVIRKAGPGDLETLLVFEQGVISAERPFDITLKGDPNHYYDIEKMITAKDVELLVAEIDGELIGSGYARIENAKPYLLHAQHAYLGFMYVVPHHRGKGVNKMIIEALSAWSAAQNITELRLDVYNENEPAIKAYERSGFTKYMINMRMGMK
ncbi:MAG TPA: GNAT family N-acetyltransferase [Ferruginibacter sp.]|nr:GNAT family N-acetyltransferase [Ferruginibacter sp.]